MNEYLMIFFLLGIILGSLGSVLITRLHGKTTAKTIKGIIFGRSICPHCQHQLLRWQLIPIIGYTIQQGKCFFCKKRISILYPLIEGITAITLAITYYFLHNNNGDTLLFRLIINRIFILISIYDLLYEELFLPGRTISIGSIILFSLNLSTTTIINGLKQCIILSMFFIGIYFLGKYYSRLKRKKREEGFGQGDIYMSAIIGYIIGITISIEHTEIITLIYISMIYIVISSCIGLIHGTIININKKDKTNKIGFIPSMIIGLRITIRLLNIGIITK